MTLRLPTTRRPDRLRPNDAEAYCSRGGEYRKRGDYDAAIADYTEAIRLEPNNAEAYFGRGLRACGTRGIRQSDFRLL